MDTTPVAAPLPSVTSSVDDILTSITALSLSADDAQRLITAIEDAGVSTAGTRLMTPAPPVTSIPAASPVASSAVVTTAPVAVPPITTTPVAVTATAPAPVAPVIVPAIAPALTAPVIAPAAPAPPPPAVPAIVPAPAAPVFVPAAPPLVAPAPAPAAAGVAAPVPPPPAEPANPIMPVIPAVHFTLSHHGVLYLVPLQDVAGPYYVVTKGKSIGVIADWNRASPLVTGVKGAVFCKVLSVDQGIQAIVSAIDSNMVGYL